MILNLPKSWLVLSAFILSQITTAATVYEDVSTTVSVSDRNLATTSLDIDGDDNVRQTELDIQTQTGIPFHPRREKRLTESSMSPFLRKMEYAVRGSVVIAADKINDQLKEAAAWDSQSTKHEKKKKKQYPFDKIIYTNIGNPHSVGQKPLTWPRQVMALVDLPNEVGIDHPDAPNFFPLDAIERAREIKGKALSGHGSGAYSHSKGAKLFREDVCSFLQKRDGKEVPTDPENIFLTNGASAAISQVLQALIADSSCGVMIPIPQYPIYSATLDLLGGEKVGYYLDEENNWNLELQELERSYQQARKEGTNVVGFVLINPGNPTGSVLSKKAVQDVVRFCARHNLVLLADEVYQENVYDERAEFYSAKRAAYDIGLLQNDGIELASFHSTSKGVFGECGRRGGYVELCGFDEKVKDHLYKLASSSLCSSLNGQIMTSLMVRGPNPGDQSYESHESEKAAVFDSLKRRASIVGDGLNSIPGFSCQPAQGAMYCFPSVMLPQQAIDEALQKGLSPDTMYALSLLEQTGIVVVPASGFGQKEGRYGFRTTFLPTEEEMAMSVDAIQQHHSDFWSRYTTDR
ncbi:tyrosine/nicotianamine aminotransferase [Nitzschia inconspicua]|uniref:Tyrosine/nicotianamine aminotransferase n=1 Tax=Nitzschia inconspicua TaxID=303405 RepID=A0A9K3L5X0_9STRA|nr:tyrosine/nicotianamine aminotransferase [Nitzschia inconspicua]